MIRALEQLLVVPGGRETAWSTTARGWSGRRAGSRSPVPAAVLRPIDGAVGLDRVERVLLVDPTFTPPPVGCSRRPSWPRVIRPQVPRWCRRGCWGSIERRSGTASAARAQAVQVSPSSLERTPPAEVDRPSVVEIDGRNAGALQVPAVRPAVEAVVTAPPPAQAVDEADAGVAGGAVEVVVDGVARQESPPFVLSNTASMFRVETKTRLESAGSIAIRFTVGVLLPNGSPSSPASPTTLATAPEVEAPRESWTAR